VTKTCPTERATSGYWVRLCFGFFLLLVLVSPAPSQLASPKVARVEVKHVGPRAVSDDLVRANIRVKPGDSYLRAAVDDDVRNLYATGFFYNLQVTESITPEGVVLTYVVQGKPRLTEIRFQGNKKYSDSKLRKKITSKPSEPLDERKLFTDSQEIQKMYQKAGYPRTEVKYRLNIDENAGRGTATFEITENPKVKIVRIEFVGATAFTQRKLRGGLFTKGVIKTHKHWLFSWLTGSGHLKDDVFEDDKERLAEFYRDHGYIDFEIKDVQFLNPTPNKMVIRFIIYEGRQYKVGAVKFSGNKLFSTQELITGMPRFAGRKTKTGPNGLPMDVGDDFTPKGLTKDIEAIEDFYGSKGYVDVSASSRNLIVNKIANTETGTMDLEFQIDEGQKSFLERIEIRGNNITKDKVIRRELAVAPGETFDMVRVKLSKERLQGLGYFEKVDARPEPTDVPNRKNLVVGVDEKKTGNMTVGAGFSSVDAIVGFAEVYQGNFDLFHPPTFSGGGQKFRLRLQVGTRRQDYLISFIEPWFLGRRLSLGLDLYYREASYQSISGIYDEVRYGGRLNLTRALGSEFLIGSLGYTAEEVGIDLNPGWHGWLYQPQSSPGSPQGGRGGPTGEPPGPPGQLLPPNVPQAILDETGYNFMPRLTASLAYDTRNSVQLPNKGQRTELIGEYVGGALGGSKEFYKLELRSAWYFPGLLEGHVLEVVGRTGVADSLESGDVPFYDRYYLGGMYTLRGFKYRRVSPRESGFREPIGGDTYWFGSVEYSIPIIQRLRLAVFYDIGSVSVDPYRWNFNDFSDNYGVGIRLNLPIGPLRLDYGIPIHADRYNERSGQFQFGVGWERPF
jgi:outer membrane protein insertion porin family